MSAIYRELIRPPKVTTMKLVPFLPLLLLGGIILQPSAALTATDYADCCVNPDPHYRTFDNTYYDFHAACDSVLVKSGFVDVHLRTELKGGWAGTTHVAIGIGNQTLEMQAATGLLLLNGVSVAVLTSFAGFPFTILANGYSLDLLIGQFINVTDSYLDTYQVCIRAHGSDFLDAEAMCGKWTESIPNDLVGRDGTTVFPPADGQDFGLEWQVDLTIDPDLFVDPGAENCTDFTSWCNGKECVWCENFPTTNQENCCTAEDPQCGVETAGVGRRLYDPFEACKGLLPDTNPNYRNCIFDVVTTGDVSIPTVVAAYSDPLPLVPPQCSPNTASPSCEDREDGECVFDCNAETHDCLEDLCTASDLTAADTGACRCQVPKTPKQCTPDATACADQGGTCTFACNATTHDCRGGSLCAASGSDLTAADLAACVCAVPCGCPGFFLWLLDLLLGWFFHYVLNIDLCPCGLW